MWQQFLRRQPQSIVHKVRQCFLTTSSSTRWNLISLVINHSGLFCAVISAVTWTEKNFNHLTSNFRFVSDGSHTGQGFHIEFNALNIFTECGGRFSNSSGVLTSPFYPNQYRGLEDCLYLISQPYGSFINITFITLDINCPDHIELRDGSFEDSLLMGKFCGNYNNIPPFMTTSQNIMKIR